ncbi:MAG TPA: CopD family protein, partial [Gammaproteobacteria bacterium]|nr:CopD family protein [Gammaproteobacteria bacterium]
GWLHTKLALVGGLIVFHLYCLKIMREFRAGTAQHSHVFYRWINEIPALLLIAIVLLAVVKPF